MENKQIEKQTYTISEIAERYRILNENFCLAIHILSEIRDNNSVDESQLNQLKELDIEFEELEMNDEELAIHGECIMLDVLESQFEDALKMAVEFYNSPNIKIWHIEFNKINKLIIKLGFEVSYLLKFNNMLFSSFKLLDEYAGLSYHQPFILEESNKKIYNLCNFDITNASALAISNLKERIKYYHNEIASKELYCIENSYNSFEIDICKGFIAKCKKAIDITTNQLNNISKFETDSPVVAATVNADENSDNKSSSTTNQPQEVSKNPAFTTSRQVLALYYLLNEIDHKGMAQIDRTEKARFIEFLTGKNYDNIYSALSNPFKGLDKKNPKKTLIDLEYISQYFENLGLQSIVTKIKNDSNTQE